MTLLFDTANIVIIYRVEGRTSYNMYRPVDMILTDAPFVDILVYNTKILALNCVIKNEDSAVNNETKQFAKDASLYIKCREDTVKFTDFTYTRDILSLTSLSEDLIDACVNNRDNIPEDMRDEVCNLMKERYLETYVECNNYYRMLMGLPDNGDEGIIVDESWLPEGVVVKEGAKLHELSQEVLITMDNMGTLAEIYDMYPKARYIDYMGQYSVDPYLARKAGNFELLYVPPIENESIRSKFITQYNKNRSYVMRRVYSDAYKFESDYYDSFITVYLLILTMTDMLNSINDFIINKEIFDSRCIRHMFESYGMPYYSEIPIKYQLKLLKNIHKLIKYKSSTKNMEDVCALFGYDNIQIFKFYLLKHRLLDANGNYVFATKEVKNPITGEVEIHEDPTKEYELTFVKVPMDDQPDEYIKHLEDHISYDVVTYSDYYWDGGEDHEAIKNAHLETNFGYKRVKYISIDTIEDNSQLGIVMPYFLSMLYDTVKLEEALLMYVPYLNKGHYFRLTDIFCYLFALTNFYNGTNDDLYFKQQVKLDDDLEYYIKDVEIKLDYDEMEDTYSISNMEEITNGNKYISAFNLRPDNEFLNKYFADHYVTRKDLGIVDFRTPTTNIIRYETLLEIFETNKEIYLYVCNKMKKAENKKEYDIYKTIYDHMFRDEFTLEYFLQPDGTMPTTYTEYLRYRDTILYISLKEIQEIAELETRRREIDSIVSNVLYALDDYIDTDTYRYLFNYMPTVSAEFIKKYIVKIIDIFKSYKLQLYDISSQHEFGGRYGADTNQVQILSQMSDIQLKTKYRDMVEIKDDIYSHVTKPIKDRVCIDEAVLISLYYEEDKK